MQTVDLGRRSYTLVQNFKNDPELRRSFNELTETTFDFNFEDWYQKGFWDDNYIPYALLHKNKIVSNVSVTKIDFVIENQRKSGIQIGTVMTDPDYRRLGLSRFLLQWVISQWKDNSDFVYLFANDSVLDFYPKFNFGIVEEHQHSIQVNPSGKMPPLKRLDLDKKEDRELLMNAIRTSIAIAKVSARENLSLIMFYCLWLKKNSIYHLTELDTVVIADFQGDTLHLDDVFSGTTIQLTSVISSIVNTSIKKVVLGFTPLDDIGYERSPLKSADTLFVLKDNIDYFNNVKWRFPVLSHA
ncbi:GNAT family N-acetyltransferase [Flagellimonas flava]|uniref:Ribosomal protein S18 acetylase RimI n=1 Tax=Flagellimonas flava TaxID=570519 RepID=A0A1M5HU51_9FLAO|nr:GNAT family N-acetyltransferase [Allomuricauda flava]SHG19494.1 Ribosomal protein S18 acetylase RimI [Allomuricauda flava]